MKYFLCALIGLVLMGTVSGVNVGYLKSDIGIPLEMKASDWKDMKLGKVVLLSYDWGEEIFFCGYEGIVEIKVEGAFLPDLCRKRLEEHFENNGGPVTLFALKKGKRGSLLNESKKNQGMLALANCVFALGIGGESYQYIEDTEMAIEIGDLRTRKSIRRLNQFYKQHSSQAMRSTEARSVRRS